MDMRVRFLQPHDHHTAKRRNGTPLQTISYAAGAEDTLKRTVGEALVAAGKAVEIDAPPSPTARKRLPKHGD